MAEVRHNSKRKEIITLLSVLGLSLLFAAGVSIGMLYYYNPLGSYLAGNMLLEPLRVSSMQYSEATVRGGDNTPFIYAGIEYSYFDEKAKLWKKAAISLDKYTIFYGMIANERSLLDLPDELKALFLTGHPSSLSLLSKKDNGLKIGATDFVRVDFSSDGDHYRVQLRVHPETSGAKEAFVYFYHAGIGALAQKLFLAD